MPYNYDLCFKTPEKRWIFVPTDECRTKGSTFIEIVLGKWSPPPFFYHFRAGGHVAAIEAHKGNLFFAKIDIQKFFPSIPKNKLLRTLKSVGLSYYEAGRISEWSVVVSKDDKTKKILPYGFVQSPLLAALYLDKSALGKALHSISAKDVTVSVYVDDIVLSSKKKGVLETAYQDVVLAVQKSGFTLNQEKSHAPQKYSTAFNIDFDKSKMEISSDRFEQFANAISPLCDKKTEAIISYVYGVCPKQGGILIEMLKACEESAAPVATQPHL